MTYFAIGESTGGAGESRLGPFSTPEEAAQAGRKETKDSNGAFVFRGVVDEANNQVGFDIEPIVSTNSVVRNAMAVKSRVARNESLEYKIVIDLPNRQEVVSPLFSSEWAATVRAKDIAAKTGEKVRVVHRPTGNVVWKNAIAANRRVAKNATYNNFDKKSVEDATKRLESAAVEMSRLVPAIEQAKKIISELDPYKMEDPSTGSQDTDEKFLKALRQYIPLFKKADTLLK